MSSARMEQVFYHTHAKVSHCVLRRTSHRTRSLVEHAALVSAVVAFCVVLLSHRTFVRRANANANATTAMVPNAPPETGIPAGCLRGVPGFREDADVTHVLLRYERESDVDDPSSGGEGPVGSRAFTVRLGPDGETWILGSAAGRQPQSCVEKTSGDDERRRGRDRGGSGGGGDRSRSCSVFGDPTSTTAATDDRRGHYCAEEDDLPPIPSDLLRHVGALGKDGGPPCHSRAASNPHGDGGNDDVGDSASSSPPSFSPVLFSYSHIEGLLLLSRDQSLRHAADVQYAAVSSSDARCFGDPFARGVVFKIVGPDTPIVNWILALQQQPQPRRTDDGDGDDNDGCGRRDGGGIDDGRRRQRHRPPRFVSDPRTGRRWDFAKFDSDRYSFSSVSEGRWEEEKWAGRERSAGGDGRDIGGEGQTRTEATGGGGARRAGGGRWATAAALRKRLRRFLRFLAFKAGVLASSVFVFFIATSLVSFTFQETQDRMLEFALQLRSTVRAGMPPGPLVINHVVENLVFVPIMVGMVFFLIEFYGGDKFLAFAVLSVVWVCEVFSTISVRSIQGIQFFPRVFFLYFTLFHVYFFSCPVGFTYASLASTVLFLVHAMLFFLNRYELPALHSGLINPDSPRMVRPLMGRDEVAVATAASDRRLPPHLLPPQHPHRLHPPPPPPPLSSPHPPSPPPSFFSIDDRDGTLDVGSQSSSRTNLLTAAVSATFRSFQSAASLDNRASSPNVIFQGGYTYGGSPDSEDDDSYTAYVSGRGTALSGTNEPGRSNGGNLYVLSRDADPATAAVPRPGRGRESQPDEGVRPGGGDANADTERDDARPQNVSDSHSLVRSTSQMSQDYWE